MIEHTKIIRKHKNQQRQSQQQALREHNKPLSKN